MDQADRNGGYGGPDWLTMIAIAMLAYVLTVVFHELGGHGGACMALGGYPREVGAYYFDCDDRGMADARVRLVAAAGNTANLIMAAIAFPLVTRTRSWYGKWFWWLMFSISLLDWSGYFLFSGVSGIGDWGGEPGHVFHGVAPQWAWRSALACAGGCLYFASAVLAARRLSHFVHSTTEARRISLGAYAAGGVLALLVGLLNPIGVAVVLASALASTLGGTSGLLWLTRMMPHEVATAPPSERRGRSWAWVIASLVTVLLFALVLGPSWKVARPTDQAASGSTMAALAGYTHGSCRSPVPVAGVRGSPTRPDARCDARMDRPIQRQAAQTRGNA